MIVVVVDRDGFEIFSLEYLVAIQASDIIDPVTPRENLCAGVLANRHIEEDYPYSKRDDSLVKPQNWFLSKRRDNRDWFQMPGRSFGSLS